METPEITQPVRNYGRPRPTEGASHQPTAENRSGIRTGLSDRGAGQAAGRAGRGGAGLPVGGADLTCDLSPITWSWLKRTGPWVLAAPPEPPRPTRLQNPPRRLYTAIHRAWSWMAQPGYRQTHRAAQNCKSLQSAGRHDSNAGI